MTVAIDLRLPIYTSVTCRCLDVSKILSMISQTGWEVKEVMTQHSTYVDVIIQVSCILFYLIMKVIKQKCEVQVFISFAELKLYLLSCI